VGNDTQREQAGGFLFFSLACERSEQVKKKAK